MADLLSDTITGDDETKARTLWNRLTKHLNFYRIHILFFTFTPVLFSIVFYFSNGEVKISFVDSLFNCVSAMAVCGLATVDLSSLTPWQQVILFIQMSIGNPIIVSWFIVFSRKRYIDKHCSHLFTDYLREQGSGEERRSKARSPWKRFMRSIGSCTPKHSMVDSDSERGVEVKGTKSIRTDMIRRRSDVNLRPVNPSGWITDSHGMHSTEVIPPSTGNSANPSPTPLSRTSSSSSTGQHGFPGKVDDPLPRSVTFEVKTVRQRQPSKLGENSPIEEHPRERHLSTHASISRTQTRQTTYSAETGYPLQSHPTNVSYHNHSRKHQGFGGFPMPFTLIKSLFRRLFPGLNRKLQRTLTIPATTSLTRVQAGQIGVRQASYIRDPNSVIKVGRNSDFQDLSRSELYDFGYKEYEALRLLLWIIAIFHIAVQLIGFIAIAPYISTSRWKDDFVPPQLVRPVNSVWFSAFQVVSAYTNTGTSLVDQSMLPFQSAYVMIFFMIFLILAGNTCFPILLRFTLWCLKKLSPTDSHIYRVLDFLLDHPRRCYIYLFPSHQTWFLLTIVIGMTFTDWIFFIILDIGNEALDSMSPNLRVLAGFMQAVAVRAAGFAIVPLASLAPAVKVLYVIMMYISVYPIAMSVRSTNVYETNSLGIFEAPQHEDERESTFNPNGDRVKVWGRYLAMHMRQQLAFDMWWIVLGVFLVCIIEGGKLSNPETASWFNIFIVLFELVSAYGVVGLSLGVPHANYSFSGDLKPLSKLIICLVMIRGRHRGLPVAIDRAILFPKELRLHETQGEQASANGDIPESNSQPRVKPQSIKSPDRTHTDEHSNETKVNLASIEDARNSHKV